MIRLAVMMYVRYLLSLRLVEDLLFECGIDISYETVRFGRNRFRPYSAQRSGNAVLDAIHIRSGVGMQMRSLFELMLSTITSGARLIMRAKSLWLSQLNAGTEKLRLSFCAAL